MSMPIELASPHQKKRTLERRLIQTVSKIYSSRIPRGIKKRGIFFFCIASHKRKKHSQGKSDYSTSSDSPFSEPKSCLEFHLLWLCWLSRSLRLHSCMPTCKKNPKHFIINTQKGKMPNCKGYFGACVYEARAAVEEFYKTKHIKALPFYSRAFWLSSRDAMFNWYWFLSVSQDFVL